MKNKKWICRIGALAVCSMLVGCGSNAATTESENVEIDETETVEIVEDTETVCEHEWIDAACAEPKHCSICGETEGEPLEHTLTEANYQQAATCEVCGETVGEPLQADFEKLGLECNAELDTEYSFVIPCYDTSEYETAGKITFSDYTVFESDEVHEALDGYEWRAVTVTLVFDDENAYNYGYSGFTPLSDDYYHNYSETYNENADTYTINYNGTDFAEVKEDGETLQNGWNNDIYTYQMRAFFRVPKGYDGIVLTIVRYNSATWDDDALITDIADDDTIFFRLK